MKTVVGLYRDMNDAQRVVNDLAATGIDRNNINFVANDREGTYSRQLTSSADTNGDRVAETAAGGALTGAALGGLGGLLLGLGALAIPGIGPVIAAGPLAAALTGAAIGGVAGGLVGALIGWGIPEEEAGYYAEGVRRGGVLVAVQTEDNNVERVVSIMNRYDPIDIERESAAWRANGWTGFNADEKRTTSVTSRASQAAIPVVEEELFVGKREVDKGGVRVRSYVEQIPVSKDVELREEHINVERRPVNRAATSADLDNAFQERTIEMTEHTEEPVAQKRARVTEEVVVDKNVDMRTETITDTVRRTDVDVERFGQFEDYYDRYQNHFNTTFAGTGYTYDDYAPAYEYGYTVATDDIYRNRNWSEIEPDVRRSWERDNDGAWDDFKDAVRQGWYEVRNAVS